MFSKIFIEKKVWETKLETEEMNALSNNKQKVGNMLLHLNENKL